MPFQFDDKQQSQDEELAEEEERLGGNVESNTNAEARAQAARQNREAPPADRIAELSSMLAGMSPRPMVADATAMIDTLTPEERPAPEQISEFEVLLVNDRMLGEGITHSILYVSDPDAPGTYIKIDFSPSSDQTELRRVAQEIVSIFAWPVRGKGNYEPGYPRPSSRVSQVIQTSESVIRAFLPMAQLENNSSRWEWYRAYTNNCQDHTNVMLSLLDQAMAQG